MESLSFNQRLGLVVAAGVFVLAAAICGGAFGLFGTIGEFLLGLISVGSTATPEPTSASTPTPTATSVPPAIQSPTPLFPDDPADAARLYYETINEGSYALAWSMLTANFQQNSNQDDFGGYVEFWMKSSPVTLEEVVLEDTIGLFEAHVRVRLFYVGGVDESSNLHILVRDSINHAWRIDRSIP